MSTLSFFNTGFNSLYASTKAAPPPITIPSDTAAFVAFN